MLPVYLFALIVGGGLLLFSLLSGGDHDSSVDADADADGELTAHAAHSDHGDWSLLQGFLSVRTLLYLLAGFGATGALIELLTDAGPLVSLLWAVVTGAVAATAAGSIYAWVRASGSGEVPSDPSYLIGVTARVLLPLDEGRRGKIVAVQGGREIELLARLYGREEESCPRGSEVVIVEVEGDTALVTPLPRLSSESTLE
ncbi:MAG TPA: hypothetical protein VF167_10535 [Longimicrobiaceae bacterium]